jgi:hypothetical protein
MGINMRRRDKGVNVPLIVVGCLVPVFLVLKTEPRDTQASLFTALSSAFIVDCESTLESDPDGVVIA